MVSHLNCYCLVGHLGLQQYIEWYNTLYCWSVDAIAIRGSWFTKDNHLKSCIRYTNALLSVIIFIGSPLPGNTVSATVLIIDVYQWRPWFAFQSVWNGFVQRCLPRIHLWLPFEYIFAAKHRACKPVLHGFVAIKERIFGAAPAEPLSNFLESPLARG